MRKSTNANREALESAERGIIERVRQLRVARFGPRGASHFATALGICPSSYHYYETNRVPPPALLVQIAQITQADLVWLLTGQGSAEVLTGTSALPGQQVVKRVAGLLEQRPAAGRAMAAFMDLFESIQSVEQRLQQDVQKGSPALRQAQSSGPHPAWKTMLQPGRLIPVLGRAAAASPQFWANMIEGEGLTNQLDRAVKRLQAGKWATAQAGAVGPRSVRGAVALVQLVEPTNLGDLSIHEMLDSSWLAKRWPGSFALRVDGESMLPILESDDLVILSPKIPAVDGEPAVVQMAGQIGVTCKIYRQTGDKIRLIPANPAYPTTVHAIRDVIWALQVLARVQAGKTA